MRTPSWASGVFAALVAAFLFAAPVAAQVSFDLDETDDGTVSFGRKPSGVAASLTLDAPAYTRTVTASSYTLTGTSVGSGAVSWAASPSGASGACTGTDTFSCVVTVTPDATGEGVEVITVTRGAASDTETLGFYVAGAHSVFLSQNVDGDYNSTLSDLDAVATWQNVGTSGLDVTQATGTAQPTFRTSIVGGQPVVRCDGGDRVAASTASDWIFLHNGVASTVETVGLVTSVAVTQAVVSTSNTASAGVFHGNSGSTGKWQVVVVNNVPTVIINYSSVFASVAANLFSLVSTTIAAADTPDASSYRDAAAGVGATASGAYGVGNPAGALSICRSSANTLPMTGDLFAVRLYSATLTSTQRGINKAVDEWALGGTLPVTP